MSEQAQLVQDKIDFLNLPIGVHGYNDALDAVHIVVLHPQFFSGHRNRYLVWINENDDICTQLGEILKRHLALYNG